MLINQAPTACAVFHSSNFQPQQQRILDMLAVFGGDWTIGEIAAQLDIDKSAVSGRRKALLSLGESSPIELGAERKCRISRKTVQTVHLKANLFGVAA
jgi:hypothetical protein